MPQKKIAIVDADFGNLGSIINAINHLGFEFNIIKTPSDLESYSHLILPGVGSYNRASKKLQSLGWFEAIKDFAETSKPLLGICLGMQLMFEGGEEDGLEEGLSFFKGQCKEFSKDSKDENALDRTAFFNGIKEGGELKKGERLKVLVKEDFK